MKLGILLIAVLIVGQLFCGAAEAQVYDQILLKNGVVFRAGDRLTVTAETYREVEYKTMGTKGTLPQSKVAQIMWGDSPTVYRNGVKAQKKGKFKEAIKHYQKAINSTIGRKWWIEPYSIYNLAVCYRQAGQSAAAEKEYNRLIKQYPKARFYPNAHIDLGEIALARGNYDEASAKFDVVRGSNIFDVDLQRRAQLGFIDALIAKKAYAEATVGLEDLIEKTATSHADIAMQATLKRAWVMIVGGDRFDAGVAEYRRLIKDAVKKMEGTSGKKEARLNVLVAQCYNGLGDAYLKHSSGKNHHKRALLEYLRVVTVLGEAVGAECAPALAGAATCFEATGDKERAEELRAELKLRFPGYKCPP